MPEANCRGACLKDCNSSTQNFCYFCNVDPQESKKIGAATGIDDMARKQEMIKRQTRVVVPYNTVMKQRLTGRIDVNDLKMSLEQKREREKNPLLDMTRTVSKDQQPQKLSRKHGQDYMVLFDTGAEASWLCVSCHEYACNCQASYSIQRYAFCNANQDPDKISNTREKGLVVPPNYTWDLKGRLVTRDQMGPKSSPSNSRRSSVNSEKLIKREESNNLKSSRIKRGNQDLINREEAKASHPAYNKRKNDFSIKRGNQDLINREEAKASHPAYNKRKTNYSIKRGNQDLINREEAKVGPPPGYNKHKDYSTESVDEDSTNEEELKTRKKAELIDFASSPITARKPFIISSPHWLSRRHTQQWPWNSKPLCNIYDGNVMLKNGERRKNGWFPTQERKKGPTTTF